MNVIGYKANANFLEVKTVLKKHLNVPTGTATKIALDIEEGKIVELPDDFVLREDLEDLNILVD